MNLKLIFVKTRIFTVPVFVLAFQLLVFWVVPSSRNYFSDRRMSLEISPELRFLFLCTVFLSATFIAILLVHFFTIWENWFRNKLFFFILLSLIFTFYLAKLMNIQVISQISYKLLRVSYYFPNFADFRTIWYGISCPDVNAIGDLISCDNRPNLVPWNYPTWLLYLRVFFPNESTQFIPTATLILFLIFLIIIYRYTFQFPFSTRAIFLIVLFSPPLLLAIERFNFDLLIFGLLLGASIGMKSNKIHFLNLILISIACLLKFYAIAFLVMRLIHLYRTRQQIYSMYILALLVIALIQFQDYKSVTRFIGQDMIGTVGLQVFLGLYQGSEVSGFYGGIGMLVLLSSMALLCFYLLRYKRIEMTSYSSTYFSEFGLTFFLAWLSATNFYYRMMLLVPIVTMMITDKKNPFFQFVGFMTFFSFYFSPSSLGPLQNFIIFNSQIVIIIIIATQVILKFKSPPISNTGVV